MADNDEEIENDILMNEFLEAACHNCARHDPENFNFSCAAFPKQIPLEILEGKDGHTEPVKGDGGLLFLEKK